MPTSFGGLPPVQSGNANAGVAGNGGFRSARPVVCPTTVQYVTPRRASPRPPEWPSSTFPANESAPARTGSQGALHLFDKRTDFDDAFLQELL